jgi:hypothetical protein
LTFENEFIDSSKKASMYLGISVDRFLELTMADEIAPLENSDQYRRKDLDIFAAEIHKRALAMRNRRQNFQRDLNLLDGYTADERPASGTDI